MRECEQATNNRQRVGQIGEIEVQRYVQAQGWQIVDHNVRWREGELDLIALDQNTLVFAEVKTLVARGAHGASRFSPFESIDARKQEQVRSLARRWLADPGDQRPITTRRVTALRFDAFAVTLARDHSVERIEHLADAF